MHKYFMCCCLSFLNMTLFFNHSRRLMFVYMGDYDQLSLFSISLVLRMISLFVLCFIIMLLLFYLHYHRFNFIVLLSLHTNKICGYQTTSIQLLFSVYFKSINSQIQQKTNNKFHPLFYIGTF